MIPFIIIFILSILIILFNIFGVDRFLKKFKPVNSSIYYTTYFLIGLEIVIIKRLVDYEFLSIFLILGITMFTDNYNALRYYNGIFSVWTEHLRTIPNDSRINNQLLFLADNKETSVVEKHIMKVMNLSNRVIEGLGERMR